MEAGIKNEGGIICHGDLKSQQKQLGRESQAA